jgi:hypothetical protein
MSGENKKDFALLAEFANPSELLHAAEKVRDRGYRKWDTHSPFPVHGMDDAMGLKPSKLGWLVMVCGMTGMSGAFLLQWWASTKGYAMIISGKPLNSYPAFVPITFEGGILLSAFAAVFGMFFINRLPQWYHGLFHSQAFKRATDDSFFISIEAEDPQYDRETTETFFKEIGAKSVELVEE